MSLTYKINRIGERGLPRGTPWMGVIGSLSWSWIDIISLSDRKLLIHLINFLFRTIGVNLKRSPSHQTWSKAFSTSGIIPVVGWPLQKPNLTVSKSLNKFVLLFFLNPFCCLLNFALASPQLLRLSATAFSKSLPTQEVRLRRL